MGRIGGGDEPAEPGYWPSDEVVWLSLAFLLGFGSSWTYSTVGLWQGFGVFQFILYPFVLGVGSVLGGTVLALLVTPGISTDGDVLLGMQTSTFVGGLLGTVGMIGLGPSTWYVRGLGPGMLAFCSTGVPASWLRGDHPRASRAFFAVGLLAIALALVPVPEQGADGFTGSVEGQVRVPISAKEKPALDVQGGDGVIVEADNGFVLNLTCETGCRFAVGGDADTESSDARLRPTRGPDGELGMFVTLEGGPLEIEAHDWTCDLEPLLLAPRGEPDCRDPKPGCSRVSEYWASEGQNGRVRLGGGPRVCTA